MRTTNYEKPSYKCFVSHHDVCLVPQDLPHDRCDGYGIVHGSMGPNPTVDNKLYFLVKELSVGGINVWFSNYLARENYVTPDNVNQKCLAWGEQNRRLLIWFAFIQVYTSPVFIFQRKHFDMALSHNTRIHKMRLLWFRLHTISLSMLKTLKYIRAPVISQMWMKWAL